MPVASLAPQTAAGDSGDITVAAGTPVTFGLYTAAGGELGFDTCPRVPIKRKNPSGTYEPTGIEMSTNVPGWCNRVIAAAGVYKAFKPATTLAIGIVTD